MFQKLNSQAFINMFSKKNRKRAQSLRPQAKEEESSEESVSFTELIRQRNERASKRSAENLSQSQKNSNFAKFTKIEQKYPLDKAVIFKMVPVEDSSANQNAGSASGAPYILVPKKMEPIEEKLLNFSNDIDIDEDDEFFGSNILPPDLC